MKNRGSTAIMCYLENQEIIYPILTIPKMYVLSEPH